MYLYEYRIHTLSFFRELLLDRVEVNGITHFCILTVLLTVDHLRLTGTYIELLRTGSYRIYSQVQLVVFQDITISVRYNVIPSTGGVVVLSVHPNERQITLTNTLSMRCLSYYMQRKDTIATVSQINRIVVIATACDRVLITPCNRLIFMKNLRLCVALNRRDRYFYIDNTIADTIICGESNCISMNNIRFIIRITVHLTANRFRLTATYGVVLGCFRYGVDSQVQTIDTVTFVHRLISPFVLLTLRQIIVHVIRRTIQPMERQIGLTDRRV